ncbi:acetyl-coenzyme A synthetase N-terminal domain-containing protein [Pyrobaculum aerophilum]|uniref:Acetyl-coenzyme A synthetase N-terminal domain-containing protein n=1 Tax=Pyrobaculum aerophilum TaxID=13773 RepID=A0A371R7E3_9CREN|nr:acetyl-coenzyme A synthetase N-terminal domain-containing protein [Pyrobaculum aerophilum]RFB00448.1 hypothetical protein CGL52_00950 [Pyrobaculum aerophilum]
MSYFRLYQRWKTDPDGYWREFIEKTDEYIYWAKKPEKIFEWNPPNPFKWFVGGYTNAGYSAVDYKLGRFGDKTAYIYINPEAGVLSKKEDGCGKMRSAPFGY